MHHAWCYLLQYCLITLVHWSTTNNIKYRITDLEIITVSVPDLVGVDSWQMEVFSSETESALVYSMIAVIYSCSQEETIKGWKEIGRTVSDNKCKYYRMYERARTGYQQSGQIWNSLTIELCKYFLIFSNQRNEGFHVCLWKYSS